MKLDTRWEKTETIIRFCVSDQPLQQPKTDFRRSFQIFHGALYVQSCKLELVTRVFKI